ncbi:hypothetical protein Scep_016724 [Stephania cephalantha]|uniref:Uncharacterized protein n=1 Tax=Stephania cephalantha TaxID=152367 RepID=A0AAP0NW70_9MAGN
MADHQQQQQRGARGGADLQRRGRRTAGGGADGGAGRQRCVTEADSGSSNATQGGGRVGEAAATPARQR